MNNHVRSWQLIRECLHRQEPVVLLYVLQSSGSSPGRQGFTMAVAATGSMAGSVGGGIMEHKFVELARDMLQQAQPEPVLRKQIHSKKALSDQSGMICSGEQTILVYPIKPEDAEVVEQVISCLEKGQPGLLQLSPLGIEMGNTDGVAPDFSYSYTSEQDWLYQEKLGVTHHLHIIGGGHCALALSRCMQPLDFCLHLYEDRPGLNTFEQNEYVQHKTLVMRYEELAHLLPSGENTYVVVMTFGYRTDDTAVRALLGKKFKYFGVLGSSSKIKKMFGAYQEEGISEAILQSIHAPIGLRINSQTPAEIAISIAAEIIQVKNSTIKKRMFDQQQKSEN